MENKHNEKIVLYDKKDNCCGCGVCSEVCPKKAISMHEEEYGFVYPKIDYSKCINCGKCKKNCPYQNKIITTKPICAYAASSNNNNVLVNCASGGVFSELALEFIRDGGIVYGCAYVNEENRLTVQHIRISNENDLHLLQGSKYVQSSIQCYKQVKEDLESGKKVLFAGTPCQIAGVKSFVGNIDANLFLIDLICHGVPSESFFNGYISVLSKKINGRIINFKFRDKSYGWGMKGKIIYEDKRGRIKEKVIYKKMSSYFSLFLDSEIYRENCYSCKHANINRIGDITIGDYWGIEEEHPSYLETNKFCVEKGISCILCNNNKGKQLLDSFGINLILKESSVEQVCKGNSQLREPSHRGINRDKILEIYKNEGYESVEKWFNKKIGMKRIVYFIWMKVPYRLQKIIKGLK